MNHLDLFSGIGGFSLAGQWVWKKEYHVHRFIEIDLFCQKVLKKHWPNTPIHDDIRTYNHDGTKIDLLTGGFPCQPFSVAGKQRGKEDDRYLWPEMLRVITEVKPTWVIGENVTGIINMELDKVLSDLEDQGYETAPPLIIPACAVDAPHRRDRVWIVAHPKSKRLERRVNMENEQKKNDRLFSARSSECGDDGFVADASRKLFNGNGISRNRWRQLSDGCRWLPESGICRVAHGVPRRVDRLRALGNAIVPQVVVPIMESIKKIEELDK